jgi:hypothetical protein
VKSTLEDTLRIEMDVKRITCGLNSYGLWLFLTVGFSECADIAIAHKLQLLYGLTCYKCVLFKNSCTPCCQLNTLYVPWPLLSNGGV